MDLTSLHAIRLSLQVAFVSTFFVAIVGIFVAYLMARRNFFAKSFFEILMMLPLVLPPTVTGYYLVIFFGRNGLIGKWIYELTDWSVMFSWWGGVLASFIVSFPLMVKTAQTSIESVDQVMIDSSYMLGYSEWETFRKVIVPLSKKGIIAGVILAFARGLGEFGATLMIAGNIPEKTTTMPLAIYSFASSGEWGKAQFLVAILTLFSGVFIYFAHKHGKRSW